MQGNGYGSGEGGGGGSEAKPFRYRDLVQVQWSGSGRANNRYVYDRNGQRRRRQVRRNRHIKGRLFMLAVTVVLVVGGSIVNRH
jgi:hypothetical protein